MPINKISRSRFLLNSAFSHPFLLDRSPDGGYALTPRELSTAAGHVADVLTGAPSEAGGGVAALPQQDTCRAGRSAQRARIVMSLWCAGSIFLIHPLAFPFPVPWAMEVRVTR